MFRKKSKINQMIFGKGYSIDDPQHRKMTISIPDSDRKGHFWCFGTTRVGKALSIDALVHTPDGWKRMGDMKVGDKVTTPDGEIATVTGVFPQGIMDLYKVEFEDGRWVEATADHLWGVYENNKLITITTREVIEKIKEGATVGVPYIDKNPIQIKAEDKYPLLFKEITPSRKGEAICIKIDSEDGLFITNDYIVTHNTRLMEEMVIQDIRKGYSTVIIDPKGDVELLSNIVLTAAETGRLDDLILVSPIYPQYSAIIDPLSHYYMPEELVGHIVSGVETGKEPFFYNVAYEISLMVVLALIEKRKRTKEGKGFSLLDVKNVISHEDLENLAADVNLMSYSDEKIKQLYNDIKKILESPQDYYSKVSSSLRVALTELTSGNIGKIIGQADANRFVTRLENGKTVILIAQLGSLLTRKAAFTVGKVLISMIQSYVGRIFSSGRVADPPLALYIDEAQNVMYYGIDDLFAKAGGANVWVHGFCQSVNQIYKELGEAGAKTILDNTNTKIFMRVPDPDTGRYASAHFGTKRVLSPILSSGGGLSSKEDETDMIEYDKFITLPQRVFYMITYSGRFKVKTLDTDKVLMRLPNNMKFRIAFPKIQSTISNKEYKENISED